jgi:hypothetical protein
MSTQVPPSRLDSTKDFSSLVPSAFARANAAFLQANNSTDTWVRVQANNAYDSANAAFLQANNSTDSWVRTQANNSFNKANSAADFANGAFTTANSGASFANAAFDRANAAYTQANTGGGTDAFARTQANSSFNTANAAFDTANAAFAAANTGGGGGTTAAYVKTYYWKGALTENVGTLRHYIPLVTANVTSITSYLASPGLTQSTAVVKKNGTVINTIRFAGAGTSNTQTGLTIPVTSSDYLTVDITQSSSGSDLYINFIYQG